MKDLVQKLREASEFECAECALHYVTYDYRRDGYRCGNISCLECVADSFNALADRIEREYDPDPDPDTVEKVALVMLKFIEDAARRCDGCKSAIRVHPDRPKWYRERLEALGVKVDD